MREKLGNGPKVNVELEQFLEDIKTVVKDGQALLRAGVSTVKERATAGAQGTDRLVRERPYQTMGVAFGIGVLVGLIVSYSLRRDTEIEED